MNIGDLEKLAKLIRYYILIASTTAGSGHPTSSFSSTDLMTALMFGGIYRYDLDDREHSNNDRLIFSKGHASPLFYSLYAAAGRVSEEDLKGYRKFGTPFEGHPTTSFPYTEVATGSLGQGLSIGVGMAINAKFIDKLPYNTFVLLGDSEMSEGSNWEAIQIAAYYGLDNLIGIIDVNRLGQSSQTMYGHDIGAYEKRISSFDWQTILVEDGHSMPQIMAAYTQALKAKKPAMIIAKTIKGKGISFWEDKDGWHGKSLPEENLARAVEELGRVDKKIRGVIEKPQNTKPKIIKAQEAEPFDYKLGELVATRKAYGQALARIYKAFPDMVVMDAEVSNSTYSEIFKKAYPDRYFEMFIAEQNMVGTALGLARRGKIPFISTFAAFFARAFDQIRMSQYSPHYTNIKFAGSHTGVSIGEDGPSQMGLLDIAIFRSLRNGVVLYPSDAVSAQKCVQQAAAHKGNVYIRLTRKETPVIYQNQEEFPIGGSKILKTSDKDVVTIISAGITLHEALAAYEELKKEGIFVRVVDLYCIKPIDKKMLINACVLDNPIITVEDHYHPGGLGEEVISALCEQRQIAVHIMAVKKLPKSGSPQDLLEYEEISKNAIVKKVKEISNSSLSSLRGA